jgi:hypothetical protein
MARLQVPFTNMNTLPETNSQKARRRKRGINAFDTSVLPPGTVRNTDENIDKLINQYKDDAGVYGKDFNNDQNSIQKWAKHPWQSPAFNPLVKLVNNIGRPFAEPVAHLEKDAYKSLTESPNDRAKRLAGTANNGLTNSLGGLGDTIAQGAASIAPKTAAPKRQLSGPERLAAAIMNARQDQISQLHSDRSQASTDITGWINDSREGITAARGDYNKAYSGLRKQGRQDTVGLAHSGDPVMVILVLTS